MNKQIMVFIALSFFNFLHSSQDYCIRLDKNFQLKLYYGYLHQKQSLQAERIFAPLLSDIQQSINYCKDQSNIYSKKNSKLWALYCKKNPKKAQYNNAFPLDIREHCSDLVYLQNQLLKKNKDKKNNGIAIINDIQITEHIIDQNVDNFFQYNYNHFCQAQSNLINLKNDTIRLFEQYK